MLAGGGTAVIAGLAARVLQFRRVPLRPVPTARRGLDRPAAGLRYWLIAARGACGAWRVYRMEAGR
jgi:hypothetical protein